MIVNGSIPLVELARSLAIWQRLELTAAAILGRSIPTIEPVELRAVFAGWAAHHVWHAELWEQRYPAIDGWAPVADMTSIGDVDAFAPAAATAPAADDPVGLIGWLIGQVWTPLIAELERTADAIDPALDAPTLRVIELVLADLRRDLAEAGALPSGR